MLELFKKFNSKRKQTKGQAALEYMITYGWAFLVIIAAISVLGYFGFLNPNKYIPERCEFGEQLKCVDFSANTDRIIQFRFQNNFGTDINISSVGGDGATLKESYYIIRDGEVGKVEVKLNNNIEVFAGSKERFDISFNFSRTANNAPSHITSGTLFAEVINAGLIS